MARLRSNTLTKVCETEPAGEYQTPQGGTLAYGPCRRHGWFMAMVHCPTADIRKLAEALLEAVDAAEKHGNKDAGKTSK